MDALFTQAELAVATTGTGAHVVSRRLGSFGRYRAHLQASRAGEPHVLVADAEVTDEVTGRAAVVWQGSPAELSAGARGAARFFDTSAEDAD